MSHKRDVHLYMLLCFMCWLALCLLLFVLLMGYRLLLVCLMLYVVGVRAQFIVVCFNAHLYMYTPSPPTKSLGFRGFDSSRLSILRGGNYHIYIIVYGVSRKVRLEDSQQGNSQQVDWAYLCGDLDTCVAHAATKARLARYDSIVYHIMLRYIMSCYVIVKCMYVYIYIYRERERKRDREREVISYYIMLAYIIPTGGFGSLPAVLRLEGQPLSYHITSTCVNQL